MNENLKMRFSEWDHALSAKLRIKDQKGVPFRIAAWIAHSGDSWLCCGLLLIIWFGTEGWVQQQSAYWGLVIVFTATVNIGLKRFFKRHRPNGDWGEIYRRFDPLSFPSGHAMRGGVIFSVALFFCSGFLQVVLIIWCVWMSVSRIQTGVHYLFDIFVGFLLGIGFGLIAVWLQPLIFTNFPSLFDRSLWGIFAF